MGSGVGDGVLLGDGDAVALGRGDGVLLGCGDAVALGCGDGVLLGCGDVDVALGAAVAVPVDAGSLGSRQRSPKEA